MPRKTAVLYARYSSDKQREASIDDQLRVCREFCERESIDVVREYHDHALSGKTDQRPEFRQMIANAPESDYVVVYMFDRFSRDRYDSATYKKMLKDLGVRVLSASEKVEDTPEGGLQEGLLELLSEYYVADMARKIRRGMEGNALKAKDNGYKIFGYDTDPVTRRYIVNEVEAAVVKEIFTMHIAGTSIFEIARIMAERGWTTTKGNPVNYNWAWRILNREAYTGLYTWDDIVVPGGMPVIIDRATFEKSRAKPLTKPRASMLNAEYKLTGRLFCGKCGAPMHGYSAVGKMGKRYYYYGCKESGGCKRPGMRRELVEGTFSEGVLMLADNEEVVREIARNVIAAYDEENDHAAEIESVENSIAALERERHNISQAAMRGLFTEEMVERNDEIGKQLESLHNRRGILLSQQVGLDEETIVQFLLHGFDASDEEFIFGSWAHRIWLYDSALVCELNFRDADGDPQEVRLSIDAFRRRHPEIAGFGYRSHVAPEKEEHPDHEGFGCVSLGVANGELRKLFVIPTLNGFGIMMPIAKAA